jgi:hypothetical protein
MHNAGAWRMALLRMGVALDDLPFFRNQDARMQQRIKRDVRRRLETWQKGGGRSGLRTRSMTTSLGKSRIPSIPRGQNRGDLQYRG